MIDVSRAIEAAMQSAKKVLGEELPELQLEEIELSPDETVWYVTLGWLVPQHDDTPPIMRSMIPRSKYRRVYKIFQIDANTGAFRSMKIREP